MTKEEWIEQEARKARDRYWGRIGDWDRADESIRQDWRNVVAPFYQEPAADADTLEKLVEVAVNAYMEHPNIGNDPVLGRAMEAAVVAVLRAAKPCIDYEQVRVAFSECMSPKEWADYINSRIRYCFELPQPEPLRVPVDVDGLARAMCDAASRESEHYLCAEWNSTSYRDSFRAAARAALAYLNIEPCAKPDDVAFRDALKKSQEIVNNWTPEQRNHNSIGYVGLQDNERAELENLRAECKRLRTQKPETRPVKVRFDVTAEDVWNTYLESGVIHEKRLLDWILLFLTTHAVIDVPPGTQCREWTEQDVEELAGILRREAGWTETSWHETSLAFRESWRKQCRAALAWFDGKRGE